MDTNVLQQLKDLIHRESGIYLPAEKTQLLTSRLQKRLRVLGLSSADEYLEIIELDASGEELRQLLDVISTNVTYFYREERHFLVLTELLQTMSKSLRMPLKIWCAACSSGEEAFTLAMTAREALTLDKSAVRILATDISTHVLSKALAGRYDEAQLTKLPAAWRSKYFSQVEGNNGKQWQIAADLAQMVTFKRLNLAKFPLPLKGPLDVIFCRNVMIYFERDLRGKIINEFHRLLRPGGVLFLSHSENLLGIEHDFKTLTTAVYQKRD